MQLAAPSALDTSNTLTLTANTAQLIPVPKTAKFVQIISTAALFVKGGNLSSITASTSNSTVTGTGSTTTISASSIYVPAGTLFLLSLSGAAWLSIISTGTPTVGLTFAAEY